jgi:uncharacterized metal-binding protein YceD (DUF177 family)
MRSPFIIPFVGLKLGTHQYEFEVKDEFFTAFDYSEIKHGDVRVVMDLNKSATMLVLTFDLSGTITVPCDRCLEDMNTQIDTSFRQIIKFSDTETDEDDDELTYVPTGEYEIDVKPYIFNFIALSIPARNAHPEGECDPETLKKLNEYLISEEKESSKKEEEEDIDPRWSALKSFRKN